MPLAVANPYTGVAVYNSGPEGCGGWCLVGGTSVASPVLAGIANAAGHFKTSTKAELTKVYNEYGNATKSKNLFLGITVGNHGYACSTGWDYCTGVGVPKPAGE
jgi:subtilase family serine protease